MQKANTPHIEDKQSVVNTELQQPITRKAKVQKAFAIVAIVLGVFLLLLGGVVGVLHIKDVQTFIVGKVADKLSKELNVEASIASFHYRPLSHLTLDTRMQI